MRDAIFLVTVSVSAFVLCGGCGYFLAQRQPPSRLWACFYV